MMLSFLRIDSYSPSLVGLLFFVTCKRETSEPKGKPASELADSYLIHLMNVTRFFIIKQYQRSECVVDARDKTRLFLNSFLEPEGQQIFIHSKLL